MLLIKRQQKLIFHHNFCKSHWSVESNFFFLICYPYQINWRQAILDGVLSPHRILNLKLIQNERFKMDLSLRQHKPAEFAPHGQARWFSRRCCRVGHASGTLPPPRHAARAARGSGTSSSGRKQLSKRFLHGETPGAIYKGNNLHVRGSNITFKVHLVFHKGSAIPEVLTSELSNQQPARSRVFVCYAPHPVWPGPRVSGAARNSHCSTPPFLL